MNSTKLMWFLNTLLTKWKYGHIGKKSYLGKPMYIQRPKSLYIGDNSRIYPGIRAEITCENASIEIRNNVSIGQNFHVVSYNSKLIIPDSVTISGNVFISNVNHDYREIGKHILDQEMQVKNTQIGEGCFLGYGVVILPGTVLGKQCIVGANSVVNGKFPDYCVIAGSPAKIIRKYNSETKSWERIN